MRSLAGEAVATRLERSVSTFFKRPVIAVLDDEAVGAESQEGRPGQSGLLALVNEDGPVLDRGAVGVHERLAEATLGRALLLGECATDILAGVLRRAEGVRTEVGLGRVERSDRLDVLRRPGPCPRVPPAARGRARVGLGRSRLRVDPSASRFRLSAECSVFRRQGSCDDI
jgi:hypothetical protein